VVVLEDVLDALLPAVHPRYDGRPPGLDGPGADAVELLIGDVRDPATVDRALAGVNRAGPAPVANGQQPSATLATTLTQIHDSLVRSQEELAAVPGTDPASLAPTLERVAGTFVAAGGQAGLADLAFPPELSQAAQQAPNCRALQPVGASTPAPPAPSTTG